MANTIVGTISYDVKLNLAQLKKDTSRAEKIVKDSYNKINKSQSRSPSGSVSGGSKTQAEGITKDVQAQVNATKKAAKESYEAIAKYTPQIQRQFLSVERANNQVYSASTRSATAIKKFGTDSVQAQRATKSLNVAVQNQVMKQSSLDSSLQGTGKSLEFSSGAARGLTVALIAVGAAIATNLNAGIRRLDTLNNFPRTMANFGISAQDGEFAIKALAQELIGLPTSLDQGARAVQRFTAVNNDVKASTALFLAFNNAVIAGGAPMELQATALEQISQGYAKGRIDMIEWRALLTAMPAQLNQVAESMGITSTELGEGLRTSSISVDDFLLTIAKLNSDGVGAFTSFKEQAMNQVGGVQVTLTNLNTAIARSIEGMLSAIGTENLRTIIGGIADLFQNFGRGVSTSVNLVKTIGPVGIGAAVGIGALTAAMIATNGATTLATRGLLIFRAGLTLISKHPIIFALSAIVAGVTALGAAMGVFNSNTDESADVAADLENSLKNYQPPIRAATEEAGKFGKQMSKIDDQIKKANEDYRYNLAKLVSDKNENIASLNNTLASEKQSYDNSYKERLASFDRSQNDEESSHAQKTKALQNQISFLTKYNSDANKKQLAQLQFSLAQENASYQKSVALKKGEFDAETQSQFSQYELRRAENQKKLDEELALLEKHRIDVTSVRDVMLRDEIQNLKDSRDAQLLSLQQQRSDIAAQGAANGAAYGNAFNAKSSKILLDLTQQQQDDVARRFRSIALPFLEAGLKSGALGNSAEYRRAESLISSRGYATGGFTGTGGKNEPAGVVHKGEYVLPKEQVNQSTGMPKASSSSQNITVNLSMSGVMTSTRADERSIANRMGKLINETLSAKGAPMIQGL